MGFVSKLLSFGSDKDLKRYWKNVDAVNALEPTYEAMSDDELRDQTRLFRRSASPPARRSTTCCPRPSPSCARRPSAPSACATSTSS